MQRLPPKLFCSSFPAIPFLEMFQKKAPASCLSFVLEERHSQKGLANELAQHVASRRHNSARVRVAEQAFDTHMLRERGTAANAHGRGGDADGDVASSRFAFKHAQHGGLARALKMLNQIVDTRGKSVCLNLHGRELRP